MYITMDSYTMDSKYKCAMSHNVIDGIRQSLVTNTLQAHNVNQCHTNVYLHPITFTALYHIM